MMKSFILFMLLCLISRLALAENDAAGIGGLANNLLTPVFILSDFIGSTSIVIGASFIFAAVVKYLQYRVSPLAVPISTVIALFVMGIILICLPLVYKLTESGIPYSFH